MGPHRRPRDRARALTFRCLLGLLFSSLLASAAVMADADTPALAPTVLADGLVINVPQRRLFVMEGGQPVAHYPIAVGLRNWPTFLGPFTIVGKETDPVWDVPVSIQEELRRDGKPVLTRVLPGPSNPLGKYWLGLSAPGYGIHGTNVPGSVGKVTTHGCLRMRAADIADLFNRVHVGTPGVSVYQTVLVGVVDGGLWLEAHRDVYGRDSSDPLAFVIAEAAAIAPGLMLDVDAARRVLKARDGRPHRVDIFSIE